MRSGWIAGLAITWALAASCTARADSISDRALAEFSAAFAAAKVSLMDQDTLEVRFGPEDVMSVSLDRLRRQCQVEPASCREAISDFVRSGVESRRRGRLETKFTRDQLVGLVRSRDYVAGMQETLGSGRKPDRLVSRQLAGDLMVVCYYDFPESRATATESSLVALGLTTEVSLDLCIANTRIAMPSLASQLKALPADSLGYLEDPSYLLFPEDWAPLAATLGELLVAAPADNILFYVQGGDPKAVDALRTLNRQAMREAPRPISETLYRWTPQGWQALP